MLLAVLPLLRCWPTLSLLHPCWSPACGSFSAQAVLVVPCHPSDGLGMEQLQRGSKPTPLSLGEEFSGSILQ